VSKIINKQLSQSQTNKNTKVMLNSVPQQSNIIWNEIIKISACMTKSRNKGKNEE